MRRHRRGARSLPSSAWWLWPLVALAALPFAAAATTPADDTTFVLSRNLDPDGLTFLKKTRLRSPAGFLYTYPFEPPERTPVGDWRVLGFAELGWLESWGADDQAYFEEYADVRSAVVSALRLETRHTPSGFYLDLGAQAIGRDDTSIFLEGGLPGSLRLRGFYDELPHRYANDARVLFDGAGTENLTLPTGLLPGANTDAAIDAALTSIGETRVAIARKEGGVDLRLALLPGAVLHAAYRLEERTGERPFGGAIRFAFQNPNFGSVVETLEPIDARTHDFEAGLSLTLDRIHLELGYEGSVFDNRVQSLTWDNPFQGTGVDQGRFALAGDNTLHRGHATVSVPLPARGRWTTAFSWATARQDARLLPPTLNPNFPDWTDPTTALSRPNADARVDTTHATSTLRISPLRSLSLGLGIELHLRENRTRYTALNPSTGEFGYVVEDGAYGVRPRFAAAPYDEERWSTKGSATWKPLSKTRLSLEYKHEEVRRDQRARRLTREDRGRVSFSTRRLPHATLRLAYEVERRDGSSFDRGRDAIFYSSGPPDFTAPSPGTPERSLDSFEQFDLADRVVHEGTARINFLIGETGDLALATRIRDEDYDTDYGLRRANTAAVDLELSLQPSPKVDGYVIGGVEWRKRRLDTIDSATFFGTDFAAGGPVFPFENEWTVRSESRVLSLGAGVAAHPFARLELRADYQFLLSRERISYDFASDGALAPGVTAAAAGSRFPHLRYADHVVDASAEFSFTDHLSARLLYRFQRSRVRDFQQQGLLPRIGHALYLGHVDEDFNAHVLGGTLKVSF